MEATADNSFSDKNLVIVDRVFHRGFKLKAGQINFEISTDSEGKTHILLNFHRTSRVPQELIDWLGQPIGEIREKVKTILSAAFPTFSEGDLDVNAQRDACQNN
jgi:hypothetical protein